ncbi:protein tyrosine phosphatase, partial [Bracoviriform rubeculae]
LKYADFMALMERSDCEVLIAEEHQKIDSERFGKFRVTTTSVTRLPHYVKSTIVLTDGTEATQTVTHFNFSAWPDHDVPKSTSEFLNFVLEVRQCQKELYAESLEIGHQRSQPPPIVVHCNAGLGRTPCFCVVDISISRFDETQTVSIASIVSSILRARFHSLFNPFQYLFCDKAVKMYIESAPV